MIYASSRLLLKEIYRSSFTNMSSFRGAAIPPTGPSNSAVSASIRELREQVAALASAIEQLSERVLQGEQSIRDGVIASAAMMQVLAGRINNVEYGLQLEHVIRETGSTDVPADKLPERATEDDFVERVSEVMDAPAPAPAPSPAPVPAPAVARPAALAAVATRQAALVKQNGPKTKAPDVNLPPPPPPPPVPLAIPKYRGWGVGRVH